MGKAIKLKGTFKVARIDQHSWFREMEEIMTETLKDAAVAWLTAAIAPIPSWSGASLGTFSKLAAEVDFQLSIIPNRQGAKIGLGPGAGAAASQGHLRISTVRGTYAFEYSTTLAHLIYNEYNNANVTPDPAVFSQLTHPGPYNFQEAGRVAFEQVAQSAKLPVPKVIVKETIRVK